MKLKHVLIITTLLLLGFVSMSKAEGIGDQITTTLTDHVSAHSQWTTKGEHRLALMDAVILIGKMDGSAIAQGRFGFTAITNPDGGVERGSGYVADVYLNLSPFVRKYVKLAPHWTFLNSIEAGPSIGYDFRAHHTVYSFSVGLAFGLQPKP